MNGGGAVFDKYLHANPGHVGFYERFMAGEKMPTHWVNPTDYEKPAPAPMGISTGTTFAVRRSLMDW